MNRIKTLQWLTFGGFIPGTDQCSFSEVWRIGILCKTNNKAPLTDLWLHFKMSCILNNSIDQYLQSIFDFQFITIPVKLRLLVNQPVPPAAARGYNNIYIYSYGEQE